MKRNLMLMYAMILCCCLTSKMAIRMAIQTLETYHVWIKRLDSVL